MGRTKAHGGTAFAALLWDMGGVLRVAVMVWGGICCQLSTFLSLSREQQNLGVVRKRAVGSMSVEKVPWKKVCSECGVLVRL